MLKNEIGNRYGRLFVIERAQNAKDGSARWVCMCDCGAIRTVAAGGLRNGTSKSCGCFAIEKSTKHKMCFTLEYKSWQGMKERCHNPKSFSYSRYGGRGIIVCDRWRYSFENFFSDMGKREKHQSIDRIDNNGNYEPSNCRWVDAYGQANNQSSTHFITAFGKRLSVSQWAREIGITPQAITKRLKKSTDVNYILRPKK